MGEQQPHGITELEQKLDKIDFALGKASRVNQSIGTPESGRPELDISPSSQLDGNAYLDAAIRVGRVRKALAENAIPRLTDLRGEVQKQINEREDQKEKLRQIRELMDARYLPPIALEKAQEIVLGQTSQGIGSGPEDKGKAIEGTQDEKPLDPVQRNTDHNREPVHSLKQETLELLSQLQQETDDHKVQQMLDDLPLRILVELVGKRQQKRDYFITIHEIASKAGFYFGAQDVRPFANLIQQANIPIRILRGKEIVKGVTHYIIPARYGETALKTLKEDPGLSRFFINPVKLMWGEYNSPYPNVSHLLQRQDYDSVATIFRELGIKTRGPGGGNLKYSNFFTSSCPVPIFKVTSTSGYYYPKDQKEELKAYVELMSRAYAISPIS